VTGKIERKSTDLEGRGILIQDKKEVGTASYKITLHRAWRTVEYQGGSGRVQEPDEVTGVLDHMEGKVDSQNLVYIQLEKQHGALCFFAEEYNVEAGTCTIRPVGPHELLV
jgi:hypothetical protein